MKVSTANSGLCGHPTDYRSQYATYGAIDASIIGEERAK